MEIIRTENISKKFGQKNVLHNVSFSVREGEIFGFLGPSGAGKTTLIKILTGQLKADGGSSELFGLTSTKLSAENRAEIGIMMDETGLYDRLSVYDNLKVFADIFGIDKKKITDTLREVGLYDARKKPAGKLSKGMKSRLRLARPLLQNPKIMFLDEPTSGLDPATAEEIHNVLLKYRDNGCTIFLTTHNMTEAHKLCDRIALLNQGMIVEEGAPGELCLRYDKLRKINITMNNGDTLSLPAAPESADRLAEIIRNGLIRSVHSSEPDLETVFMELTGNKLNV